MHRDYTTWRSRPVGFEDFVYDGLEMVTPAALPGLWERTVTVFSLSKGYGLSGLRVGYLVAHDEVMDRLYGAAVNVVGATSTPSQLAALAALGDEGALVERHRDFEARRHAVADLLCAVPGVRLAPVESGYLSWVDVSALGSGEEVAAHVLREARVAVNDGAPYGPSGAGSIRLVHGCHRDPAEALGAVAAVADALAMLAGRRGPA